LFAYSAPNLKTGREPIESRRRGYDKAPCTAFHSLVL
jgi:hypothetical protein